MTNNKKKEILASSQTLMCFRITRRACKTDCWAAPQFLIQWAWGGAWEAVFLICFQGVLIRGEGSACSFLAGYLSQQPRAGGGSLRETCLFMASPTSKAGSVQKHTKVLFPKEEAQKVSCPKQHLLWRQAKGSVSSRKSWECCEMLRQVKKIKTRVNSLDLAAWKQSHCDLGMTIQRDGVKCWQWSQIAEGWGCPVGK